MAAPARNSAWLAAFALALAAGHYLYLCLPDHHAQIWAQYRGLGLEGAILWAYVLGASWRGSGALAWLGIMVSAWGLVQHVEMDLCSFAGPISSPYGQQLCTAHYGPWPNILIAAVGCSILAVWRYGDEQAFGGIVRSLRLGCAAGARTLGGAGRAAGGWLRRALALHLKI